jgi:phospholipase C
MLPPGYTTIFTIVMENRSYEVVIGSPNAPYINMLAEQYGLATNYYDSMVHPSLPNYLYLTSGTTVTILSELDIIPPKVFPFPEDVDNIGNQLTSLPVRWRAYAEDMHGECNLDTNGNYVTRHVPFLYYSNIQNSAWCTLTQVDFDYYFWNDLAEGKTRYMWITPNLLDDGHNPTDDPAGALRQADAWTSMLIPKILASDVYQRGGVIFLTWDEGTESKGDHVPMIIISPKLRSPGYRSDKHYTHANFLATVEDIFGLPRLGDAAGVDNMLEFLNP